MGRKKTDEDEKATRRVVFASSSGFLRLTFLIYPMQYGVATRNRDVVTGNVTTQNGVRTGASSSL